MRVAGGAVVPGPPGEHAEAPGSAKLSTGVVSSGSEAWAPLPMPRAANTSQMRAQSPKALSELAVRMASRMSRYVGAAGAIRMASVTSARARKIPGPRPWAAISARAQVPQRLGPDLAVGVHLGDSPITLPKSA